MIVCEWGLCMAFARGALQWGRYEPCPSICTAESQALSPANDQQAQQEAMPGPWFLQEQPGNAFTARW